MYMGNSPPAKKKKKILYAFMLLIGEEDICIGVDGIILQHVTSNLAKHVNIAKFEVTCCKMIPSNTKMIPSTPIQISSSPINNMNAYRIFFFFGWWGIPHIHL